MQKLNKLNSKAAFNEEIISFLLTRTFEPKNSEQVFQAVYNL